MGGQHRCMSTDYDHTDLLSLFLPKPFSNKPHPPQAGKHTMHRAPQRCSTPQGVGTSPTDKLFRLGLLIVGLQRHPFTIQLTQQHRTLRDLPIAMFADLSCTISKTGRPIEHHGRYVTPRFFRALVRRGRKNKEAAPRYLRVGDADTVTLMKMQDEAARAWYVAPANEIASDADLTSVLSSEPTREWTPDELLEEIHVLVVLDASRYITYSCFPAPPSLFDPGPKIPLFRSRALPQPQLCYAGDMDRRFHLHHWWPEDNTMRLLLEHALNDADGNRLLPVFDHVQFLRRHCERRSKTRTKADTKGYQRIRKWWSELKEYKWARSEPPYSLPRLSELAENVVFHSLLSGSPQFLDPVDCVVDASLLLGRTVVLQNVLCFVKFLINEGEKRLSEPWTQSVNPRMLELLDQVAEMGDPSRPQLFVIATTRPGCFRLENGVYSYANIEGARLPTTIPTAVVDTKNLMLASPIHEPMRYLGNAGDVDVCEGLCHNRVYHNGELLIPDPMLQYDHTLRRCYRKLE